MPAVDLNRGVCQRNAEIDAAGGTKKGFGFVGYYYDAPGEYFDENGNPVDDEVARAAGHDVDAHRREQLRQKKIAEARKKIDAEIAEIEAKALEEAEYELSPEGQATKAELERARLAEQAKPGTFLAHHTGSRWFQVLDHEGVVVSGGKPLSKQDADALVLKLTREYKDSHKDDPGGGPTT